MEVRESGRDRSESDDSCKEPPEVMKDSVDRQIHKKNPTNRICCIFQFIYFTNCGENDVISMVNIKSYPSWVYSRLTTLEFQPEELELCHTYQSCGEAAEVQSVIEFNDSAVIYQPQSPGATTA